MLILYLTTWYIIFARIHKKAYLWILRTLKLIYLTIFFTFQNSFGIIVKQSENDACVCISYIMYNNNLENWKITFNLDSRYCFIIYVLRFSFSATIFWEFPWCICSAHSCLLICSLSHSLPLCIVTTAGTPLATVKYLICTAKCAVLRRGGDIVFFSSKL